MSKQRLLNTRTIPLAAFTAAYMLAAIVAAFASGNGEFVFYIVVMFALIGAVAAVHLRVGLSTAVLWCLSIWGAAHMAGGLIHVPESWPTQGEFRVLYSWWLVPGKLKFDHVVHAYGFAVTTAVMWECLRHMTGIKVPTVGLLVVCAAAAMGFGALNEVVEFAATLLVPETNVGGYINTGWDLVANLFGVTTAAVILRACSSQTPEGSSGPRQTVYNLSSTFRARLTLARMSVADAVQMKGLGLRLCALMYSVIAPIRSSTL